jgi:hypothetical protein
MQAVNRCFLMIVGNIREPIIVECSECSPVKRII